MKWSKVADELPKIPEGRYAVSILACVHDNIYEEISPNNGTHVEGLIYDDEGFKMIGYGPKGCGFYLVCDEVTHWMYYPEAIQKVK